MTRLPRIEKVEVEEGAEDYSQTSKILRQLDGLPVRRVKLGSHACLQTAQSAET